MSARGSSVRRAQKRAGPRPARGDPGDTRARLVMAAAAEIEQHGYFGTDTNRIARAAGYAPGTFYKHFADKRAVLLAVYGEWVTREWAGLAEVAGRDASVEDTALALADAVIAHHRAWPGFRASLRALVATDPVVRKAHRAWRRRQLATLRNWTGRRDAAPALALLTIERVADALADGEASSLGLSEDAARNHVADQIAGLLRRG